MVSVSSSEPICGLASAPVPELVLVSTRVLPGDRDPFAGYVHVSKGKIAAVGPGIPEGLSNAVPVVDVGDNAVIPGLIDLHVHGVGGFSADQGDVMALERMARFLAESGVTAFQPTIGAGPVTQIERAILAVKEFTRAQEKCSRAAANVKGGRPGTLGTAMARSLGLHMEGPFLSGGKPGAMPRECLLDPDLSLMKKWIALGEGTIRHVTLAPELPGALPLIRYLADSGVTVAMGHTMATYDEAVMGFRAGISMVSHTFNAMREFHHREPGALGAALTRKGVYCEIIADCIHVHPGAVALLVASRDADSVCLISDAITPAGLPPGVYEFLGQAVSLDDEGRATLAGGTLAGSVALMRQGLRNMVELVGMSLEDALRMATVNPAKASGVYGSKGSLASGKDADVVVLSPDYEVLLCLVEGAVAKAPQNWVEACLRK